MKLVAASVIAVSVLALARAAVAAPEPIAVFLGQLSSDPKAAAASLADCELVLAPNGEARAPCKLTLADLAAGQTGVTLKATRVKYEDVKMSVLTYVDADVEARAGGKVVATFHVIAIDGGGPPDDPRFRPLAMHVARYISDKDATAKAKAKQLPAPATIKDLRAAPSKDLDEQDISDRTDGLDSLKSSIGGGLDPAGLAEIIDDGGVVYGSAPGQKYLGKQAAKQVKAWKLGLQGQDAITSDGGSMIVVGAADVVATTPDRTTLTYAALVVGVMHMIADSGDHVWETKLVSFGVPQ